MESKEVIDFLRQNRDLVISREKFHSIPSDLRSYMTRKRLIIAPHENSDPAFLHYWVVSEKGKQTIMEADEQDRSASREFRRDLVSYATLAASLISAAASLLK